MKKREVIIFLIIFCIAIISTISFLQPHYSVDTIEFLTNGYEDYVNSKFLVDGRIFSVILLKFVIDLPMKYVIPITYTIGILISCIAVMVVRKIIIEYEEDKSNLNIIPTIIAYVIIFNFMYTDTFQFIEFPIISISILLYIISAKILTDKKEKYNLKSLIITTIAMFCYQGTFGILIVTTIVLNLIKNDKINKNFIVNIVKSVAVAIIAILINYSFTQLIGGTSRLDIDIIKKLKNLFIELDLLIFNSGNHYFEYLQLIIVLTILIWSAIRKNGCLKVFLIYFFSIIINLVLLLSVNSVLAGGQYGRIFLPMGAAIGYILMYLWCRHENTHKSKFLVTIIIIYLFTNLFTYSQYTYFYMIGQNIDKEICMTIDDKISEYEKDTGIKVTKYSYKVKTSLWNTENFLEKDYTNNVILLTIITGRRTNSLLNSTIINIYTDRNLEQIWLDDEEFDKIFENKNIYQNEKFNDERFVFVEDTLYIWI